MTIANLVERLVASTCDGAVDTLARWADPATVAARLREHAFALLGEPAPIAAPSLRDAGPPPHLSSAQPRSARVDSPGLKEQVPPAVDRGDRAELIEWSRDAVALVQPRSSAESRPFPHAIAWYRSRALRDPGDAMALRQAALSHFADLDLAALCIFRHGIAAPPGFVTAPYKRWVAGAIRELIDAPPPRGYERVSVRRPVDLAFYPEYQRMYEAFWEAEPRLGRRIGMEAPEQFLSHAADDGLRLIDVDGELGGVIGAFRHQEVGLHGWRIEERVMHERYRGQGLASAALRRFVEDLPGSGCRDDAGETLIWGTILVQHAASLGSALRLGRVDIGGLWWLDGEDPVARRLG